MKPCGKITKSGKPCLVKIYTKETACRFHCKKPEIVAHHVKRESLADQLERRGAAANVRAKLRAEVLELCNTISIWAGAINALKVNGETDIAAETLSEEAKIKLGERWRDIEELLR